MPSDSDRTKLSYVFESAFGVHPGGTLKDLRFNSESLAQETSVVQSQAIRDDRMLESVSRTNIRASGNIQTEVIYGGIDDQVQAALLSGNFTAAVTVTGAIYSMASGDNSLNRSSGDFVAAGFLVGDWIKVSGFATAANNGYFKIVSVAAAKIVLTAGSVTTEAAGPTVTVTQGPKVVNSTVNKSLVIERRYADLANEFSIFKGMTIDGWGLSTSPEQIVTASFDYIGSSEASATATGGSGYTAYPTTEPINATENVFAICENNVRVTEILAFNFQMKNNLRARSQIGTLGIISMGLGRVEISGSFQAYYSTKALYDKYLGFTSTSFALVVKDVAGNAYLVDFPRVKLTAGKRIATGVNADVIADMNFEAFRHPTENVMIKFQRFDASA